MRARRRALALGAVAIIAYLTLAGLSGHLDPLDRRPLLDGIAPPPPYRWVMPPADLASSNQSPLPGRAVLQMESKGSNSGFVSTRDAQCTLILGVGTFPRKSGKTAVLVTIQALNPATLGHLPAELEAAGNAYRVRATYQPGGPEPENALKRMTVSMVYPSLATNGVTPPHHSILISKDGRSWTAFKTNDTPAGQVAETETMTLGYYVVALPRSSIATTSHSGHNSVLLFVIIGVILAALIGSILVLWSRRRAEGQLPTSRARRSGSKTRKRSG